MQCVYNAIFMSALMKTFIRHIGRKHRKIQIQNKKNKKIQIHLLRNSNTITVVKTTALISSEGLGLMSYDTETTE